MCLYYLLLLFFQKHLSRSQVWLWSYTRYERCRCDFSIVVHHNLWVPFKEHLCPPNKNAYTRSTDKIPAGVGQCCVTWAPLSLRYRLSTPPPWFPSDSTPERNWLSAFQIHCKQKATTHNRIHMTDSTVSKGSWRSYTSTPSFRTVLFQISPFPTRYLYYFHTLQKTRYSCPSEPACSVSCNEISACSVSAVSLAFIIILYFDFK